MGISWGGFNALQVAARRPPQLDAIAAVCFTDDRDADDLHYMGGCLLGDNLSWASAMFAFNFCPPDPALVGDRWRDMWLARLQNSGLWLDEWLRRCGPITPVFAPRADGRAVLRGRRTRGTAAGRVC